VDGRARCFEAVQIQRVRFYKENVTRIDDVARDERGLFWLYFLEFAILSFTLTD
jgi:hypothetical protein